MISLESSALRAVVAARGAELQSLRSRVDGHEHLWQAGPRFPRHAPWLFPTICRVPDDELRIDGRGYPMPKHGFARDLDFDIDHVDNGSAVLSLRSDARTRRHYPYGFSLSIRYELIGTTLLMSLTVANQDSVSMPFGLGFHPAFAWPLDADRGMHTVEFEQPERAPTWRATDDLLRDQRFAPAAPDGTLALTASHFADGAIILDQPSSRSLRYRAPSGRAVEMSWTEFDALAVWSPPGGGLLCLEPWRGLPARSGSSGDFPSRCDLTTVAPRDAVKFTVRIEIQSPHRTAPGGNP